MLVGAGNPALIEPVEELGPGRERRALEQLVELDPRDDLAVAGPELVAARRQRPVEDEQPPARVEGGPGGREHTGRVVKLMQRVLEIGQVELACAARFGASEWRI